MPSFSPKVLTSIVRNIKLWERKVFLLIDNGAFASKGINIRCKTICNRGSAGKYQSQTTLMIEHAIHQHYHRVAAAARGTYFSSEKELHSMTF
jgi:hypothetical protein